MEVGEKCKEVTCEDCFEKEYNIWLKRELEKQNG